VKGIYKEPAAGIEGLLGDADRAPRIFSFTDANGQYAANSTVQNGNPRAILEKGGYINSNNDQVVGTAQGEYAFSPDFKLTGLFGGTINANTKFERQINVNYPGGNIFSNRQTFDNNSKSLFTNAQLLAQYHHQFKSSELFVLIGATNESYGYQGNGVTQQGTDSVLGTPTTGTTYVTGSVNNTPGNTNDGVSYNSNQNTQETSLNSILGRIQYSYLNKYFIETNFRYDGSSNFAPDQRWGFFPSIGVKWRATEEGFLRGYRDKVGDLMPRATYGVLGNQSVNPYQYLTSYTTNNNVYGFGGAGAQGAVSGAQVNVANSALTWEKATSFDVGLDATFFERRLNFTFDYYHKITNDILQNREDVPGFYGIGSNTTSFQGLPTYNVSKVLSYGWEFSIRYDLKGKLFSHSFYANLGDNQNELLALSGGVQEYEFKREEFWFVRRVGLPITTYRGYLTNGLYQSADDLAKSPKIAGNNPGLGDQKYKDVNGDGQITPADRVNLGNPFPRYTFGFSYTVTYKGFDALIFIQGVGKRDELIRGELLEAYHYGYSGTIFQHQLDFWTPTNTNAKYPRISENGSPSNSNNYKIGSDIYKFNAAYARLKNFQIGYSLPASLLSKMHFQKLRIFVTGQNLITVSKMKIIDPEQSEFNNRVDVNSGANSARSYPTPVFWGGGLDITF
jgi:TonB-linked SusC/RagA family outer membrane protein